MNTVMAEFVKLQQAAQTYRAKAGNTDVKDQIVYWLDCWDDTTAAAIAYLNGVKAVLAGDTSNILKYNSEGKTAFDSSKNHPFWYLDHNEYAEVGVQHIVPFINTLATYVSQYAETAMDPSKVITTFITSRTDTPTGNTSNVFDGNDSTGVTYKNPNSIAKDEYVGVLYNKVIDVSPCKVWRITSSTPNSSTPWTGSNGWMLHCVRVQINSTYREIRSLRFPWMKMRCLRTSRPWGYD